MFPGAVKDERGEEDKAGRKCRIPIDEGRGPEEEFLPQVRGPSSSRSAVIYSCLCSWGPLRGMQKKVKEKTHLRKLVI